MKTLTTLFALAILSATVSAQTIKSLGYDTASGEVVANTGTNVLTFTNEVAIGSESHLLVTAAEKQLTVFSGPEGQNILTLNEDAAHALGGSYWNDPSIREALGFTTNLTSVWTATNEESAMRALAGSTNTSAPFSGSVVVDTNTLVFTNGILLEITTP
jgi:hypothetical protein